MNELDPDWQMGEMTHTPQAPTASEVERDSVKDRFYWGPLRIPAFIGRLLWYRGITDLRWRKQK